jgi:hypothetical protein
MSVGNQPTKATIDNIITTCATQMRDTCDFVRKQFTYVSSFSAAQLEALGYTAAEAAQIATLMGYINTPAAVYYGTGVQATQSNFDAALAPVWGGQ